MWIKEKIKGLCVISLSLILMACVHNSLNAQSFIVRGTLKDSANNNSIGYANCVLLRNADSSFAFGVTTGENGEFVFKNVDAGNYLLRISMIGYVTYWMEVQVQRMVNIGTIRLKQSSTSLKTLTVTGERPIYSVDGEKAIYNPTEDPSVQTGFFVTCIIFLYFLCGLRSTTLTTTVLSILSLTTIPTRVFLNALSSAIAIKPPLSSFLEEPSSHERYRA